MSDDDAIVLLVGDELSEQRLGKALSIALGRTVTRYQVRGVLFALHWGEDEARAQRPADHPLHQSLRPRDRAD